MRRRVLRLQSSDDEAENPITRESSQTLNPHDIPLEISSSDSDVVEDFVDVSDNLSPPSSSPPPPPPPPPPPTVRSDDDPVRPIDDHLRRFGVGARREWLDACVAGLAAGGAGFEGMDVSGKARMCFEQFLVSDVNFSGGGVLPANVEGMHMAEMEGPFVLQVDEIVNISASLRDRYHDAGAGFKRCLKLLMTDGAQRVYGMEYRHIRELEVLAPAGLKIAIRNVHVRRGLLLLVPEVVEVLGGRVEDLDAARQRLVNEVNKPPRGKRKQPMPPLSKRASLAAWPSNTVNGVSQVNVSVSHHADNNHLLGQGFDMADEFENPINRDGDNEEPFTYLALLMAKWKRQKDTVPFIQGKIKCILTGVKVFHFKQRTAYELRVYIDDGSLISEVLIDHNIVQKGIGHSPEEVNVALSSSDREVVKAMKEKMRNFQAFLAAFEGSVLLEINGDPGIPVALEMNQGCSASSDAWLLLKRLKFFTAPQTPQQRCIDTMDISP
ncbi:hypothetical protein QJS10_CPB04g00192 [Acorus calamus]|uniref:RecQ-mediated genome instability protein 1 n=1 Tax=Acorus calamus TaxID=4465 RepID=A0AAV9F4D1_ACOCL|nr:hypothetical protein QJS10_CPB04g00192 [Acorus calamus]